MIKQIDKSKIFALKSHTNTIFVMDVKPKEPSDKNPSDKVK